MKKWIRQSIGACTAVIAITAVCFFRSTFTASRRLQIGDKGISLSHINENGVPVERIPIRADAFLDFGRFEQAQPVRPVPLRGRVIAGVVNHHVLASDLLQRFFVSIDQVRPDVRRIILISPDHYKRGTSPISVGTTDYVTQSRVVRVDRTAIEHLHLLGVAFGDRELFEHEHGIGALIPFLAKAFPQAAIVPLVVRADIADEDAQRFGERLAEIFDGDALIIVSSDMSHYLSEKNALQHDVKTIACLQARDRVAVGNVSDDFTDNGPALVMLFSFFEALKISPTFQSIDHSISTAYGGDRHRTTSYINGVWVVSNTKTSR